MEKYPVAEAFVETLNANGVENIFFNPGVDTVPVQVAVAKLNDRGEPAPRLVVCLDESVAMSAAHGHYMVSGRPQLVMVHSELGTMQVGGSLHNAQWGRAPVILWAGNLQPPQRTTWQKDPYDQGSIVRNCVKAERHVVAGEDIRAVLGEAFQAAMTEPRGPVYLTYPLNVFSGELERREIAPAVGDPAGTPAITADKMKEIASILVEAENPLILTGYAGRYHESVASLVKLAETLCAPVMSGPTRMNFPTAHPLSAGFEQAGGRGSANPFKENVDVLLIIDYDTSYVAGPGPVGADTKIIHIDIDPVTQGRPLWVRGVDIYHQTDSREFIPYLTKMIGEMVTPERRGQLQERYLQVEIKHDRQLEKYRATAEDSAGHKPVSPDWLCFCVSEAIDDETILLNHTISHSSIVAEQVSHAQPGTLLACPGGSIQWALGASLGAKLASPESTVVNLVTDGGFVWGCPVASLWSSAAFQAPFLSVIFNNQSYGAIKRLIHGGYGEEVLPEEVAINTGVDIIPAIDYPAVAASVGAWGKTVEDPADLPSVLKEALAQVRQGKPAVVDVRLQR